MRDLSVIIPARNEEFLGLTIESVLKNSRANTEVIAILDGYWPDVGLPQHENVTLVHYEESIGQRAATNVGARISRAKYVMKLDAHCDLDEGFDVKLMENCEPDWTVIPRMYNLHAFDWQCSDCGHRTYQGPYPKKCAKCSNTERFEKVIVWKKREGRRTDFWRFDGNLRFQYWSAYRKRPEAKGAICDVMSSIGACFFMHRDRFFEIDGLDEAHGSWGQYGTEIACKSWLSGGRHVVNKQTWFAHMFRTNSDGFSFPYRLRGKDVGKARERSKHLWLGNNWDKAKYPLSWLVEKFSPVPGWEDKTDKVEKKITPPKLLKKTQATLVYYTDNTGDPFLMDTCRKQTLRCMEKYNYPIISVSQKPLDFGKNIVVDLKREVLSIFKQILIGVTHADSDVIFLLEHDLLYHPSHFDFIPTKNDTFYYDHNRWSVCDETGKSVFYHTDVPSMLCASKELLISHYARVVEWVEKEGWKSSYGYSPPKGLPKDQRKGGYEVWMAEYPSLDIRRKDAWSRKRMNKSQFRSPKSYRGWTEAEEVPGWGKISGRFNEFLKQVNESK